MKWRCPVINGLPSALDNEDPTIYMNYPSWFARLVRRFK